MVKRKSPSSFSELYQTWHSKQLCLSLCKWRNPLQELRISWKGGWRMLGILWRDYTAVTILFSKRGTLWCSQSNKMQQSNKEKKCFNNTSSAGQLAAQRTFVFTQGGFWNYLWAPLQERRLEQGSCCLYSILWARQQKLGKESLTAGLESKADWL